MNYVFIDETLRLFLHTQAAIFLSILFILIVAVVLVFFWDILQKEHTILRNYPVIGHFRYMAERLGEYFRPYFIAQDREELPFHRAQRNWVYRASKNIENVVSFGSTKDLRPLGTIFFIDAPFPILESDRAETQPVIIGPQCEYPYKALSLFNGSSMSYGSFSKNAVRALSQGCKIAGCWLNTGEGGVSPYHLESGADLVAQIGTAKYGFRTEEGAFNNDKLREIASYPQVKMFEIKLSQGAKPGKGGLLPGVKVTPEIAKIRGIKPWADSISPNRHPEISNSSELLDFIERVRSVTGKPTGFKVVLGSYEWLDNLCSEIIRRGIDKAPDFITLDGAEGGTGAAPKPLIDYMGLPLVESLPVLVDTLVEYGLRDRIKIIASGKLIAPAKVAWALCLGADFIVSARGFMFAMGCIQALRCHTNRCPTGITSHKYRYTRGFDPTLKSVRVTNYVKNMIREVEMIGHSCGVQEPRRLNRSHARIMTEKGVSICLMDLYPEKKPGVKMKATLEKFKKQKTEDRGQKSE